MSLKALIEKQRLAAQAAQQPKESTNVAEVKTAAVPAVSVESVAPAAGPKLRFGAMGKPATGGAAEGKPASEPASDSSTNLPVQPTSSSSALVESMTLDDIAGDESTLEVSRPNPYAFHDEIPVTAPDRELPADLIDGQKAFVTQLNGIYEVIHDPELFGQMIRVIMQEMQEHPDYVNLMVDQDVHTMIRGLRDSMGMARVKKAEKKTRASGGKAKSSPGGAAMASTLDEMFNADDF